MVYPILVTFLAMSLFVTLYLGIVIAIRCKSKHTPMYLAMLAACFLYVLGYLLEITSKTVDGAITANKVLYFGSVFISPCILVITANLSEVKVKPIALPFIFVTPLLFIGLAWSASSHTLLWATFEFVSEGEIPHLAVTPGTLYYLSHIHMLGCIISSVIIVARKWKSSDAEYRSRFMLILIGTLVPVFFLALYVMGIRVYGIDYTPLAVIISNILFYIAITKYGFLDFLPMASEMALHSIKEAYVLIDNKRRYLYSNESAKNIFPDLRSLTISTPIKQVENWPDLFAVAANGEVPRFARFELPDNQHFTANINEIASKKGDILGYIILMLDITGPVLYEKRIQEEKLKAERANQSKSNFLATMSHEIRTPLNAITGISEIQLQKENLPKEFAAAFNQIYSSSMVLLGIINDLLDLSKVEAGKVILNPVEYELPALINDTMHLNIVRIGSKQIEFILEVSDTLPMRLFGDGLRIKQILNNLLSNAIKYTRKGYVKLIVSHRQGDTDDDIMLTFEVKDTGQGRSDEEQSRLFSEYTRFINLTEGATEGSGLGLTITKQLVELMGGTINVESWQGKGSTFTVTVKQRAVPCEPIGEKTASRLRNFSLTDDFEWQRETCDPMPYGHVLVVDDVDINLMVAAEMLSLFELNVETAGSGFEAVGIIESGKSYDVIFMDYIMPDMDGIKTVQKLRAMGYSGPIVALSADALVGNAEMFRAGGFDDFISKPIDLKDLKGILCRYVERDAVT